MWVRFGLDGHSTGCLSNPFRSLTNLTVKHSLLTLSWYFPCYILCSLSLNLSCTALRKVWLCLLCILPQQSWTSCIASTFCSSAWTIPALSLSWHIMGFRCLIIIVVFQRAFSNSFSFTGELSTGPGTPDVSHQSWADGKGDLPQYAGNALPNAAQDAVGLDQWRNILLAHIQVFDLWGLLCKPRLCCYTELFCTHWKTMFLPLLNFMKFLWDHQQYRFHWNALTPLSVHIVSKRMPYNEKRKSNQRLLWVRAPIYKNHSRWASSQNIKALRSTAF